jgi:retinol dehydrogenase-12
MTRGEGRTYLVTGGNGGIGKAVATGLAATGARVVLACRSPERAAAAAAEITVATGNRAVETLRMDLADLDSVREAAAQFLARDLPLHGLLNNAAVLGVWGATRQGFEICVGVNHLGHFLLTALLRDRLVASAPARVVTMTSAYLEHAREIPFDRLGPGNRHVYSGLRAYAVSKLCNVLHAQELGRRLAGTGVTTYAVHPGIAGTDIWQGAARPLRPLLRRVLPRPEEVIAAPLRCLTAPELAGETGLFYDRLLAVPLPGAVHPPGLARQLWLRSEDWTGLAPV